MRQRGLTLIEVLIMLAVLGFASGYVLPSYQALIQRSEATTSINWLVAHIHYARHTAITYGTTVTDSNIASNLLLREIKYPDSSGGTDVVTLSYNRQGQVTVRKDQFGTTHVYTYDKLGRLQHDCVTPFGTAILQVIERISTDYEVRGMVSAVSSHYTCNPDPVGVANQVTLEYNDFGQLVKEYQQHGSAVTATSLKTS